MGYNSAIMISFVHMFNACLNCTASFRSLQIPASNTVGGLAETTIVLQSMTNGQMKVRTDKDKTLCPALIVTGA